MYKRYYRNRIVFVSLRVRVLQEYRIPFTLRNSVSAAELFSICLDV